MSTPRPNFLATCVLLATLGMAGCSSNPSKQEIGMVTGAVVGGVMGSTLTGGSGTGTVAGAAVGSYIGHRIGRELEHK